MKKILTLVLILTSFLVQAQKPAPQGWHLLDLSKDGYYGISLDKAYELLKGRKSTTVIVAVIDSGIDTLQEDLKPVLWTNAKEIAGNGKDDDGNGYVDDIHGWNFDGKADGTNLARNSHEVERVYHNWKSEFEGKRESEIPADKKFLYSQWTKAASIINADYDEAVKTLPGVDNFLTKAQAFATTLTATLGTTTFTRNDTKKLMSDSRVRVPAAFWDDVFSRANEGTTQTEILDEITAWKNDLEKKINLKTTAPEDFRGAYTQDRYTDINDRSYGNNNLKGGSGDHGTMVAGVIGAVRNNGIGINGIADNVRIMAVRAVPGGDEHDKDVALAIRYAVDNGASIINMSFGKPVSPYKQFVDDAVKYAASKGVLLIHGSGNDGKDITKDIFYPNPVFLDGTKASNYITVGASGDPSTGGLAAPFSNFSEQWVDIFAPGMAIYSSATDNRYVSADGTSLASPVVTGVAALLKSYFPSLTPQQLVNILSRAGQPVNKMVVQPGTENTMVKFTSLSSSGRIVNAYEAAKLALEQNK